MPGTTPHKTHRPNDDDPDFEPGSLPVEPDEGPAPVPLPDDPEQDRQVDPGA